MQYAQMHDENAAQNLLKLLARWPHDQSLDDTSKMRLVCHQPKVAPFAYLHRLYPGLSGAEIAEIEAEIGQTIPPRLSGFYRVTNGIRLFQGQVSVSGLVTDFSRDPTRPIPISIGQENLEFPAMRPEWHKLGYFRIGGVSFLRQDEIICGPDDRVLILHQGSGAPLRDYVNIFDCLESFTLEMAQFWTADGDFESDWKLIDNLLLRKGGMS